MCETGSLAVLLQACCTAVPQLPEFCRQLLAVVLDSSIERIAIIIATNRVKEKNNALTSAVTSTAQAAPQINRPQSDSAQNSTNSIEILSEGQCLQGNACRLVFAGKRLQANVCGPVSAGQYL